MTYNAIVENTKPHGYTASIEEWPNCAATGATKAEALTRLRQAISDRLSKVEIVPIEVASASRRRRPRVLQRGYGSARIAACRA